MSSGSVRLRRSVATAVVRDFARRAIVVRQRFLNPTALGFELEHEPGGFFNVSPANMQNVRMDMNITSIESHTADPADSFVDSRDFARMTRAIEFIESEFERQPRLAEIARHVGLSEFHFNRLFRRWTGLTPKQYLAEVTSRAASDALRDEPSVMDAAHAVGLSGGGRLHDLTVTLEAMTPGEIRAMGDGVVIRHGTADTPFGSAFLAETPRGLCRLAFVEPGAERAELRQLRAQFPRAKLQRDDARAAALVEIIWGGGSASLAARGLWDQLPGASVAGVARTETWRDGHI